MLTYLLLRDMIIYIKLRKGYVELLLDKKIMSTKGLSEEAKMAKKFYDKLKDEREKNGRYLSWEHCYKEFYLARERRKIGKLKDDDYDKLSLHLAFYLASWGMYRGSSFLLQRDYKVHTEVVKKILNPEYDCLWAISCDDLQNDKNDTWKKLEDLTDAINEIYIDKRKKINGKDAKGKNVTMTLMTKILMGTLGCTPAYDRFFIRGLNEKNIESTTYTEYNYKKHKESLLNLINHDSSKFVNEENEYIIEVNEADYPDIKEIKYPPMKVLDMAFWQIGFDKDKEEQAQNVKNQAKGKSKK